MRIFVDPQNYIPAEKSRSIKHCKSLSSSAKWETTKGNQWQVSRAHSLFSDLLETSIDYSPTSCLLPLCKTNKEGKNKKISIVYFLFSFLSVLSIEHQPSGWCQSFRDGFNFLPKKHQLSQSAKINLPQNVHATRKIVLKYIENSYNSKHI